MHDAINVIKAAVVAWYDTLILFFVLNLLCIVLGITVILLPPAIAALYYFTGELAYGRTNGLTDYLQAMRRYFFKSWQWGLLNIVIAGLMVVNINFYQRWDAAWAYILRIIFQMLLFYWSVFQLFVWPYLLEQRELSLRTAMRNAVSTIVIWPSFSLVVLLLSILIIGLSVLLIFPLGMAVIPLVASIGSFAVADRIRLSRGEPRADETTTTR